MPTYYYVYFNSVVNWLLTVLLQMELSPHVSAAFVRLTYLLIIVVTEIIYCIVHMHMYN